MGATINVWPYGWANSMTLSQTMEAYTDVIDLTTTGVYVVLPPIAGRLGRPGAAVGPGAWHIVAVGGTRSVAPTFSAGSNDATYDNVYASAVGSALLLSQAAATVVTAGSAVSPFPTVDMTASGFKVNVTAAATGAGIVLTARFVMTFTIVPV